MSEQRAQFIEFLEDMGKFNAERVIPLFDRYHELLTDMNTRINLVSRATSADDYWTKHYLDSITPVRFFDFAGLKVLDFGTGGGLPGIPLKILYPDCEMYLLDSRKKKCEAVAEIVKMLDVKGCQTIPSRIEELEMRRWRDYFDAVVCRSVRIEPRFAVCLKKLVKPGGKVLFYKAKEVDDLEPFRGIEFLDASHPSLGERKIAAWLKVIRN